MQVCFFNASLSTSPIPGNGSDCKGFWDTTEERFVCPCTGRAPVKVKKTENVQHDQASYGECILCILVLWILGVMGLWTSIFCGTSCNNTSSKVGRRYLTMLSWLTGSLTESSIGYSSALCVIKDKITNHNHTHGRQLNGKFTGKPC